LMRWTLGFLHASCFMCQIRAIIRRGGKGHGLDLQFLWKMGTARGRMGVWDRTKHPQHVARGMSRNIQEFVCTATTRREGADSGGLRKAKCKRIRRLP
jgi:hypothetical protein